MIQGWSYFTRNPTVLSKELVVIPQLSIPLLNFYKDQ